MVETTLLQQDPLNHKINGGLCLYLPSSTSQDDDFIA